MASVVSWPRWSSSATRGFLLRNVLRAFGDMPLGLFQMTQLHRAIHERSLEQIRTPLTSN